MSNQSKNPGKRLPSEEWYDYREDLIQTASTPSSSSRQFSIDDAGLSGTRRRNKKAKTQRAVRREEEEDRLRSRFHRLKYLGRRAPLRKLDSELIAAEPCLFLSAYLNDHPLDVREVDVTKWKFIEANSVVELNHLEQFNRDYVEMKVEYEEALGAASDIVADLLQLPHKLPFPTEAALESVRFKGDKYPGVEYVTPDVKNRRQAHPQALEDAKKAWRDLANGDAVKPHLNRIGGRGKLTTVEKLEANKENPKAGRLIFMTSHRDLLLNGVVEQRLTAAYLGDRYPISVGSSWFHGGTSAFLRRFAQRELYSCFDAAKFDSSLPPWLIRMALAILREQFVDGWHEKYDAYWNFVYEGLVEAPVMLDNGMMFERRGGSTSGHSFNTLMQSICTLIIAYTCFIVKLGVGRAAEVRRDVWVEALGDDQHTGALNDCAKLDIEDLAPVALAVFGVDWTGDKSFNTGRLVDEKEGEFQGTQYLGKYFRVVDEVVDELHYQGPIPYRPFEETVLRLYYPERGEKHIDAAWQRALGHYIDAAGNSRTREWLEGYLDFLEPQLLTDEVAWSDQWLRRFNNGDMINNARVPTRRIDWGDWLELVFRSQKTGLSP